MTSPRGRQCRICGHANSDVLEVHHLVPQRHGGSDTPENLVDLCGSCHNAIESLYDDQFYNRLGLSTRQEISDEDAPTPSGMGGLEIDKRDSFSREIPKNSQHVIFRAIREIDWDRKPEYVEKFEESSQVPKGPPYAIHCGYCHRVFSHLEHPEAARHLQIEHGVSNPYEANVESSTKVGDGNIGELKTNSEGMLTVDTDEGSDT